MMWGLILLGLWERLVMDMGPNIELVTVASVLAGLYLPVKKSWIVPAVIMVVSDMVLGLGIISVFVWTGFMVMAWLPKLFQRLVKKQVVNGTLSGIVGNLIFFLWTNFGVWLTERWGMYSDDGWGLIASYVNGLPFLKLQLLSTLMFVPAGVMMVKAIKKRQLKEVVGSLGLLTN